jgi:hypothetical protein
MALAYYEACTRLTVEIHRGFALDLGLDEEFFTPRLDRPMTTLRLLHCPPGDGTVPAGTEPLHPPMSAATYLPIETRSNKRTQAHIRTPESKRGGDGLTHTRHTA